jgi:hypothetical protein
MCPVGCENNQSLPLPPANLYGKLSYGLNMRVPSNHPCVYSLEVSVVLSTLSVTSCTVFELL